MPHFPEKLPQITAIPLLCVIFGFLIVACGAFQADEVKALATFKRSIYEDPLNVLSNWNVLDSDPCDYSGIFCCLAKDHVIKINISGSSIRGFVAPELSQLTFLEELILHDNNLIGTIPKEIGSLKYLKVLDLGSNQIIGPIPPEIGDLTSIVKINLGSNGLTGQLPYEFGNLRYLEELRLDRNKLRGHLPGTHVSLFPPNMSGMYTSNVVSTGFCRSSQLKVVDFSFNFLVGTVPKCLDYLPRISFQGNCLQQNHSSIPKQHTAERCGKTSPAKSHAGVTNLTHTNSNEKDGGQPSPSKPRWLLGLEIGGGIMAGAVVIAALFFVLKKCNATSSRYKPDKNRLVPHCIDKTMLKDATRFTGQELEVECEGFSSSSSDDIFYKGNMKGDKTKSKDITRFCRQELEVACEDFSNIIGSSSDYIVCKGNMKEGPEIAVVSICVKEEHWTNSVELFFHKKVADLARLDHKNMGNFLGYCVESLPFTRMLVFEYEPNGTLYELLHYGEELSWERRMRIILGISRGLKYLHTEFQPPYTISELNSKTVYLTADYSPKVVDFGSWKSIFSSSEYDSGSVSLEGSTCALSNTTESCGLDIQGNIYAFGLLLLEVVTGSPTYCKNRGCLAKEYLDAPQVMAYLVDPQLKHFRYDDLKTICEVAIQCIDSNCREVTSMEELWQTLDGELDAADSSDDDIEAVWAKLQRRVQAYHAKRDKSL